MIRLTHRERWLVVGLTVFAAGWVLFVLAARPAIDRIDTLSRVIPEKSRTLQELRTKSTRYLALQAGLDDLKRKANLQEEGFELLTFLESTTRNYGLTEKVTTMKQEVSNLDSAYCETIVEIELENLTIKELVEFLLKIKSSNHFLRIKSLYTKKNAANPNLLDTVMQISTLEPAAFSRF